MKRIKTESFFQCVFPKDVMFLILDTLIESPVTLEDINSVRSTCKAFHGHMKHKYHIVFQCPQRTQWDLKYDHSLNLIWTAWVKNHNREELTNNDIGYSIEDAYMLLELACRILPNIEYTILVTSAVSHDPIECIALNYGQIRQFVISFKIKN